MIVVDSLRRIGAPWPGGVGCRMISDTSRDELLGFAQLIGIRIIGTPKHWREPRAFPDLMLAPRQRVRALREGARPVTIPEFIDAMRHFRAAERASARAYHAWLRDPARGPLT